MKREEYFKYLAKLDLLLEMSHDERSGKVKKILKYKKFFTDVLSSMREVNSAVIEKWHDYYFLSVLEDEYMNSVLRSKYLAFLAKVLKEKQVAESEKSNSGVHDVFLELCGKVPVMGRMSVYTDIFIVSSKIDENNPDFREDLIEKIIQSSADADKYYKIKPIIRLVKNGHLVEADRVVKALHEVEFENGIILELIDNMRRNGKSREKLEEFLSGINYDGNTFVALLRQYDKIVSENKSFDDLYNSLYSCLNHGLFEPEKLDFEYEFLHATTQLIMRFYDGCALIEKAGDLIKVTEKVRQKIDPTEVIERFELPLIRSLLYSFAAKASNDNKIKEKLAFKASEDFMKTAFDEDYLRIMSDLLKQISLSFLQVGEKKFISSGIFKYFCEEAEYTKNGNSKIRHLFNLAEIYYKYRDLKTSRAVLTKIRKITKSTANNSLKRDIEILFFKINLSTGKDKQALKSVYRAINNYDFSFIYNAIELLLNDRRPEYLLDLYEDFLYPSFVNSSYSDSYGSGDGLIDADYFLMVTDHIADILHEKGMKDYYIKLFCSAKKALKIYFSKDDFADFDDDNCFGRYILDSRIYIQKLYDINEKYFNAAIGPRPHKKIEEGSDHRNYIADNYGDFMGLFYI
jgi:hypothetical protein